MNLRALRHWVLPLRNTPIHPQWLIFKNGGMHRKSIKSFARGRVLDIGCGDRWAEDVLAENTTYIGLDYPTTARKGYPGRPDVFADGQSLPFKNACIDTVLLMDVLEHIPSASDVLREAGRVLKHDGRLIIQVPFLYPLHDTPHDFQRWTSHGLLHLLKTHGFVPAADIKRHGTPFETATTLLAIALAKAALDAFERKSPSVLLIPLLVMLIPIVNITGWTLSLFLPDSDLMPLGYRVEAVKAYETHPADFH